MVTTSCEADCADCRPTTSRPGILVVDDESVVRKLLDRALRLHGFDVWLAADGAEAVDLYQQHRSAIALVLLDVKMPNLDGPATLRVLETVNPEVRCAFMSGHCGSYCEEELYEFGARDVVGKPFAIADLAARLRHIIDN